MVNVKPFKQKTDYDCGVACVKMVLNYYGIRPKYSDIMEATQCDPQGINEDGVIRGLRKFGIDGKYYDFYDFDRLKRAVNKEKLPVIVGWFSSAPGSHWSVVKAIGTKKLVIQDPAIGKSRYIPIDDFKEMWFTINPTARRPYVLRRALTYVRWREVVIPAAA